MGHSSFAGKRDSDRTTNVSDSTTHGKDAEMTNITLTSVAILWVAVVSVLSTNDNLFASNVTSNATTTTTTNKYSIQIVTDNNNTNWTSMFSANPDIIGAGVVHGKGDRTYDVQCPFGQQYVAAIRIDNSTKYPASATIKVLMNGQLVKLITSHQTATFADFEGDC